MTTFDHRHDFSIGGWEIRAGLHAGGETTDSLVLWLPQDLNVFTGQPIGLLFGHVPEPDDHSVVTATADPILCPEACNAVLDFAASCRVITGTSTPLRAAERIAEEVTANGATAMQSVHQHTGRAHGGSCLPHTAW